MGLTRRLVVVCNGQKSILTSTRKAKLVKRKTIGKKERKNKKKRKGEEKKKKKPEKAQKKDNRSRARR